MTKTLTHFSLLTLGLALAACSPHSETTTSKTVTSETSRDLSADGKSVLSTTKVTEERLSQSNTEKVDRHGKVSAQKSTATVDGSAQSNLKPIADHTDTVGTPYNSHAFNRPAGNDAASAINGDANNPKTTVADQRSISSVKDVLLKQMLVKDDEYRSRISTIKEHEEGLQVRDQHFVNKKLLDVKTKKQVFDGLLMELKADTENAKLKSQINVASAKLDRSLRRIETAHH